MSAPPHVCFVSPTIYPVLVGSDIPVVGGAEVQQTIIARALRRRGYRVSVLTKDYDVPPSTTPEGIEVHHLPSLAGRGLKGLRWLFPRLTDVVAALKRIDPDVVYFRTASGLLAPCAWYARRAGKRLVYAAAHDIDFRAGRLFELPRREAWLFRRGVKACNAVVVQNLYQQQLLRKRFGIEGRIVPNCYEERDVEPARADGAVIWVATIKPIKRPDLFLELARRFPRRRFILVGASGSKDAASQAYEQGIREQAAKLANVELTGFVPFDKVGRYYDGACALVNSSDSEGFPNTFLQAWVRAVPTLSFVDPRAPDGSCGSIVCKDIHDMAQQLGTLLDDEAAWQSASERAKSHFARWHSTDMVIRTYDEVLLEAPHLPVAPVEERC
jgi:glycosyltransferase involved in cell wall biosynthesis